MSNLEGINFFGDNTLDDIVCHNIMNYIKYGLLELGAFYNLGTGINTRNGSYADLRPIKVPGVSDYRVWGDGNSDWIWEQGISLKYNGGTQPYNITGIIVNNIVCPTGESINGTLFVEGISGTVNYYVDYSRGHLVFDTAISTSNAIMIPHSVRAVHTYSSDSNEFREVNWDWRLDPSGVTVSNTLRYQAYLPMISVGVNTFRTLRGLELGSRGKVTLAELEFNILAQSSAELKKLIDVCYFLEEKLVPMYNINTAPKPLDDKGRIVNSGMIWPYLVNNYRIGEGRFRQDCRTFKQSNNSLPVLGAKARISFEFDTYTI